MSDISAPGRPLMGWRLAEEVAWARPERPGPEWWTLMDIAQDARDETRQSMCGYEYLMKRGKCSKATLYRRLESLRKGGLLKVVRRSAPGIRAIYEVELLHGTGLTIAETRSPVDNSATRLTVAETRSELTDRSTGLRICSNGSQKAFETGLSVSETHPVTTTSVTTTPSQTYGPAEQPEVEGAKLSTGESRAPIEMAAWQAAQSRHQRMNGSTQ